MVICILKKKKWLWTFDQKKEFRSKNNSTTGKSRKSLSIYVFYFFLKVSEYDYERAEQSVLCTKNSSRAPADWFLADDPIYCILMTYRFKYRCPKDCQNVGIWALQQEVRVMSGWVNKIKTRRSSLAEIVLLIIFTQVLSRGLSTTGMVVAHSLIPSLVLVLNFILSFGGKHISSFKVSTQWPIKQGDNLVAASTRGQHLAK